MRKFLSLFVAALFSVTMFAADYWFAGSNNSWGSDSMFVSEHGNYEYIQIAKQDATLSFKIQTAKSSWDNTLGRDYTNAGFAGTDVTNMNSASAVWSENGSEGSSGYMNCCLYYVEKAFYVIVFKPSTTVNATDKPIICASTTLPSDETLPETKYYLKNNWGNGEWAWKETTKDGDLYKLDNVVLGDGGGVNFNTAQSDGGSVWVEVADFKGDKVEALDTVGLALDPADSTITAVLLGKYVAPVDPEPEYFLVRASKEWAVVEADKFAATETEGEFKLTATLVLDDEIKVIGIAGEDTTWYPAGLDNAFVVTEKYTGEHDIYFRPAGHDDWKTFHEGGFFWMGANPDPEPELADLFLVPNQWANNDAKIAAWYWKKGEGGTWTSFMAPKAEGNDTLVAKVNVEADSIIFVRFSAAQEAPAWMGPNQLNQTANDSIQWAKAVCTILPGGGYDSKATWDVYVPEPKGKYYIIGDAGIVGEDKAWQPDGIKAMKDTTVLSIKAGSYSMRLTLEGTWEGGQKDYRDLSEITPGLGEYVDEYANHNITFTLDADGEVTVIYIAAHDEEAEVFKILGDFHVAKNGYFLFGSHNDWALVDEQKFEQNGEVEGEYKLVMELIEGKEIKPALVKNDNVADEDWFGNNYLITAADAGLKTIYFRPAGNSPAWDAFGGFIWIDNGTTGVEETAVEGKAVKALRDGQLVIIKNGVRYNVIGIRF